MAVQYTINFSDPGKAAIIIPYQTTDESTSLDLPGPAAPDYGQNVVTDLLHLLENFASPSSPANPIEGQLWYDTSNPVAKQLKVNDGATWKPASGVFQQSTQPTNASYGDIWVDTALNQLKIYSSDGWSTVGPSFSSTYQTGTIPDIITDTTNIDHIVIKSIVDGDVVTILSKETFVPLISIDGFDVIVPGLNLSYLKFDGATENKFVGPSTEAFALRVTTPTAETVPADYFIRKDIPETLLQPLKISNDGGISIGGSSSTFILKKVGNDAVIENAKDSAKIYFNVNRGNTLNSIVTIDGANQRVGINKINPQYTLDVVGNSNISGDTSIGGNLAVTGNAFVTGNFHLIAGQFVGTVTNATKFVTATNFSLAGQVVSSPISYDGQSGGFNKAFTATLTVSAITGQASTSSITSSTQILVATGNQLYKMQTKDLFGIQSGIVVNWAGPEIPTGWLKCDGTIYQSTATVSYGTGTSYVTMPVTPLYNVIGQMYGEGGDSTFAVPNIPNLNIINTGTYTSYMYYIIKI